MQGQLIGNSLYNQPQQNIASFPQEEHKEGSRTDMINEQNVAVFPTYFKWFVVG